jgi:FMN phosphatase YigB (HAD superfamily)
MMAERENVVFLLDVDNTLLDNDRVAQDLRQYLTENFGAERQNRYWQSFEALRAELGYADYLGALQRYRVEFPRDPHILKVSSFLIDYHFANRLYPGSLDAIERMNQWGPTVVLSDGDAVFQPRKVERSGIWDAVEGRVLIYIHKEEMLDDVEQKYPARHYVMVDDKIRILTAMKKIWGTKLTTVFVAQGHYANDLSETGKYPPADVSLMRIGELADMELPALLGEAAEAKRDFGMTG